MLSPRRVKSTPMVVLYELRMIRPSTRADKLLRLFEGSVKKWRGLTRWYMQAHTSPRGETVLHIIGERQTPIARLDNLYISWRRALAKELQIPKEGACFKRATWTAIGSDTYIVDVHVMHDVFDAATAKLWAEIAGAADAVRCSYTEPAMPLKDSRLPQPTLQAKPIVVSAQPSRILTLSGPIIPLAGSRPS